MLMYPPLFLYYGWKCSRENYILHCSHQLDLYGALNTSMFLVKEMLSPCGICQLGLCVMLPTKNYKTLKIIHEHLKTIDYLRNK